MADKLSCGPITAHVPDSPEHVRREVPPIRAAENNLKPLLEAHGLSV